MDLGILVTLIKRYLADADVPFWDKKNQFIYFS